MRTELVIALWGTIVLTSCGLPAQETSGENAGDRAVREGGARSPSNVSAGEAANRWRYKFHNGHWWYYGRNNQWLYWTGNGWIRYDRPTYAQWFNRQFLPTAIYDYGRRPSGTVQREKNDLRDEGFAPLEQRSRGFIQREKNDPRGEGFGSFGRRPAGTIQREKNDIRDEELGLAP